jgi:hypothetical protein
LGKISYRLNQFRRAHDDKPTDAGLARAREVLSPELFDLFSYMQPFDQAHSIRVMDRLVKNGEHDPDLLAAALLHDVGKSKYPLRPWERGLAVLTKRFLPKLYKQWRRGKPAGIRAGIVVAACHGAWGAEMAEASGANTRVVWLIANHDVCATGRSGPAPDLLQALKRADGHV